MANTKFDGTIDGKAVKVIVKDNGCAKMWFAKPKAFDMDTPHFEQNVDGKLELHMDSSDGRSFRVMNVNEIYSGSFYSGSTFADNKGMDMAVLPMNPSATGFAINVTASGSNVHIPDGNVWCLMAFGTFGSWQRKKY